MVIYNKIPNGTICSNCENRATNRWKNIFVCKECYMYLYVYGTLDKDLVDKKKKEYLKIKRENKIKGIKCCICGDDKTHIKPNGDPLWTKHSDKKGAWDEKSYECYVCHYKIGRPKTPIGYFDGRKCCVCRCHNTYMSGNSPKWYMCKCGKKYCTKYLCHNCWHKKYYRDHEGDANRWDNVIKSLANIRTGQVSIYDDKGKGIIGEAIVAKIRKLKILAIELDNFSFKGFDLSFDIMYGRIQVKFRLCIYGEWNVKYGDKDFDTLFVICTDESMKSVVRVYAIPKEELGGEYGTTITKNCIIYEKYRIDEKPYNDEYQSLMSSLIYKKYFGIEDIKRWLYNT